MHEFRVHRPSDGALRWMRNTDFPLRDSGPILRLGGIVEDVTENRGVIERQRVLLLELQHRVRNTLAVVRSIAANTGETSDTVEAVTANVEGRLNALARTQMVLTRTPGRGADLEDMIRDELLAQTAREGRFALQGPELRLPPRASEILPRRHRPSCRAASAA